MLDETTPTTAGMYSTGRQMDRCGHLSYLAVNQKFLEQVKVVMFLALLGEEDERCYYYRNLTQE